MVVKTPEELEKIAEEYERSITPAIEDADNIFKYERIRSFQYGYRAGYQAAMPQWISVKDRLPEKKDIGDIFLVWNAYERDVSTVRWQPYGFDDVNDMYISHWMPLPETPEDKGKSYWQELREFWKARNVTISEWQEEK